MRTLATIVAAGGLALGLTACGSGDEAEQTVADFHQALADKDFETVCDTIDPELVEALEQSTNGQSCADAMQEDEDEITGEIGEGEEISIVDSEVADDEETATVTVERDDGDQNEVSLIKVEDEWKITFE